MTRIIKKQSGYPTRLAPEDDTEPGIESANSGPSSLNARRQSYQQIPDKYLEFATARRAGRAVRSAANR